MSTHDIFKPKEFKEIIDSFDLSKIDMYLKTTITNKVAFVMQRLMDRNYFKSHPFKYVMHTSMESYYSQWYILIIGKEHKLWAYWIIMPMRNNGVLCIKSNFMYTKFSAIQNKEIVDVDEEGFMWKDIYNTIRRDMPDMFRECLIRPQIKMIK